MTRHGAEQGIINSSPPTGPAANPPLIGQCMNTDIAPLPAQAARVTITPEIANDWLENRNITAQRDLSDLIARRYAKSMADGRWLYTHQGIAFDTEGWLIDGQHRLRAVVLADTSVDMFVIPDCDSATFAVLDNGYKRQAAQMIHTPSSRVVAAAARVLASVTALGPSGRAQDVPTDVILATYKQWPELDAMSPHVESCYRGSKVTRSMHLAVLVQAFRTKCRDRIGPWFDGLTSGVDLGASDPRLHLRNRFLQDSQILAHQQNKSYILIVKAWNAHAKEKSMGVLKVTDSEAVPRVVS